MIRSVYAFMRFIRIAVAFALFGGGAAYAQGSSANPYVMNPTSGQYKPKNLVECAFRTSAVPRPQWIGRPVYSRDGHDLGRVAALDEDVQDEFYVDISGFLAMGETRIRLSSDQVREVDADRIVLHLTEAEVRGLPEDYDQGEQL
jgi:hypothetical protein